MDFDTLYREVLARPEDEGARRVLGDFLAEAGDPLGELIRVQCDLAAKGPRASRALRVTEAQLLLEHGAEWQHRFAPWATEVIFSRGFPALAWTTVSELQRRGTEGQPVPELALVVELQRQDSGAGLEALPLLQRATTIELSRALSRYHAGFPRLSGFWKMLRAAPRLTGLHLDALRDDDVRDLLTLPRLSALSELSVRGMFAHTELVDTLLARLERSRALASLDLTGSVINPFGRELTQLAANGSLRTLLIDHCDLQSSNLRDLAHATARRGRAVVSATRNPGLNGPWLDRPELAKWTRQDPDDEDAQIEPADPRRPPLGRIGAWELLDLVGHRAGKSRWLVRSGEVMGLCTHLCASSALHGPSANTLAEERLLLDRAARNLVGLAQPNLVRWLDYGVHGPGPFVVHELGDCLPARQVLAGLRAADQAFTTAELARIGLDVCRGLMALHHAGLVHGAVNELTVFLTPSGTAKLLPLGLDAPSYVGRDASRFLSPEQVVGDVAGPASDLFQLGVLLHLLASHRHPFERHTDLETRDAIAGLGGELPPPLPRTVPQRLRELIERLLAAEARIRPDSAEEVLMELAMRSNQPMTGAAEPPQAEGVPWLERAATLARLLSAWGPPRDRRD